MTVDGNNPIRYIRKLPLVNFLLAAILGFVLRYFVIHPFANFDYLDWLETHSHVMFLGWATMALFYFILKKLKGNISNLTFLALILFEITVLALFVSFPSGGYGSWSVMLLSLNMAAGIILLIIIYRRSRGEKNIGWKYIRSGLFFMAFSALGPLTLGPVIALGYRSSVWYNLLIYFYLHFQYNGWFFMALAGLYLLQAEMQEEKNRRFLELGRKIYILSIILTYPLSLLNQGYSPVLNVLGGMGAIAQITFTVLFILRLVRPAGNTTPEMKARVNILLLIAILVLLVKQVLQVLSSLPSLAEYAFSNRNIIIAYLHLVLIGFVSFGIFYEYSREMEVKINQ